MSIFDQYIQHRALDFKFRTFTTVDKLAGVARITDENGEERPATVDDLYGSAGIKVRNVCAKLSSDLVERLDNTLGILEMSKRHFIEMALIDALDRADRILDETEAFEFYEQDEEGRS